MDDRVEPRRASRRWSQYAIREALGEDLAPTEDGVAAEAASDHQKLYGPPRKRQISHASSIVAMDAPGNRPARRTQTNASGGPDGNNGLFTFAVRTLYNKPTRHQTGAVECLLHGADSPPIKAPDISQTASKVSQSQNWTPMQATSVIPPGQASVSRRVLDGMARQLRAISGNRRMSETVVVFDLRRSFSLAWGSGADPSLKQELRPLGAKKSKGNWRACHKRKNGRNLCPYGLVPFSGQS
jgi:hypothetical protein